MLSALLFANMLLLSYPKDKKLWSLYRKTKTGPDAQIQSLSSQVGPHRAQIDAQGFHTLHQLSNALVQHTTILYDSPVEELKTRTSYTLRLKTSMNFLSIMSCLLSTDSPPAGN